MTFSIFKRLGAPAFDTPDSRKRCVPNPTEAQVLPHSRFEDVYAILVGSLLLVAGLALLSAGSMVTGGLAGIALLISYAVPVPAGIVLMALSLPFFVFAGRVMGVAFTVKTVAASICVSAFSAFLPSIIDIRVVNKAAVALVAGTMIGMGSLALARHGAGAGGLGILFLWLEKRNGWNPGKLQIVSDAAVFIVSAALIAPYSLLCSAISTVAMSAVLILWQRPGRYRGR